MPGPEPPREDVVAAAEPQGVRGHRLRGVLVEQRGQRVHVVALERVDVAREQLARASSSSGCTGSSREVARRERRPGALERAVDRGDARLEQLGDLGAFHQHLTQDQHRALPRRQVLQRRDEGQPDRLARDRRPRPGRRRPARRMRVRDGLDPRHLGERVRSRRPVRRAGPRSIGRARRCRPFSMSRQTLVAIR